MEPHPLSEDYRALSGEEYKALLEDIREHGQRLPAIRFEGKCLDGNNRLRVCKELGIEPSIKDLGNDLDPVAFIRSMNVHRRHLTKAEQKKRAGEVLTRNPEKSNFSIAQATGLDDKTVASLRQDLEANSEIPNKLDRVEASGRKARGRKPTKKPMAKVVERSTEKTLAQPTKKSTPTKEQPNDVSYERELSDVGERCQPVIVLLEKITNIHEKVFIKAWIDRKWTEGFVDTTTKRYRKELRQSRDNIANECNRRISNITRRPRKGDTERQEGLSSLSSVV